MNKSAPKIVSVGGSIIIPKTGFDIQFLKSFRNLILEEVKKGVRFILVIGGGATCRQYQQAAKEVVPMTNEDLDWLGIKTTIFNAEFVRFLFKDESYPDVLTNPTKKISTKKPIIVGAGWKPGCSTDTDAVLMAKTYGAKEVINLSNVDYIYDSDPRTNSAAKKIERIDWADYRKISGDKWTPGANLPFDPVAAKQAQKLGLTVKFARGKDLATVRNVMSGEKFAGSVIG